MSDAHLLARFRSQGEERLRRLNQGLLDLEQGAGSPATIDDVLREIHTLKGESRMLGLGAMNRVAHRTEDLLQHARRTQAFRDSALLEAIYAGLDLLGAYLAEPEEGLGAPEEPRAQAFESRASALLAQHGTPAAAIPAAGAAAAGAAAAGSAEGGRAAAEVAADGVGAGGAPAASPAAPAEPTRAPPPRAASPGADVAGVVRVTSSVVDDLTRTSGVLGLLHAQIERATHEAADLEAVASEALAGLDAAALGPGPAEVVARARASLDALDGRLRALREACFTATLRHQRLRDTVSSVRLAAVAGLFGRFPRTVRELARELGKEVRVEIRGGDVGADQRVLDALGDPLVHLVRNAVDHGLEPPGIRASLGKPSHGTLTLSAWQAGQFIEIRVQDDGRGMDPKAIGEAAVRKGLLSESDVQRMTREELFEQIFRPAFSTKAEVTEISGRGVGLDVVRRAVEALGGSLRVVSEVGRGSEFVLRVPVSSALVDALVVQAGGAVFALPAAYVERALTVAPSDLEPTGSGRTLRLEGGGRALVVDLAAQVPGAERTPREGALPIVLVAEGERRVALRVDAFLGQRSLVQEALGPFLEGTRAVTGTALLEDGRLAAILNVVQVLAWAREQGVAAERASAAAAAKPTRPRVVVAEDSELTRTLVVAALTRAGLEVLEAVDGREALERLRTSRPSLLVTDLEMPVLDGLGLIRRVRAEAALADLPILVFTTRDQAASKREAAEAGADRYIVKREFEEEVLLQAVGELLRGRGATS